MSSYLDFEKPVAELEAKVEELRAMADTGSAVAVDDEINRLEVKAAQALKDNGAAEVGRRKFVVAEVGEGLIDLYLVSGAVADVIGLSLLQRRRVAGRNSLRRSATAGNSADQEVAHVLSRNITRGIVGKEPLQSC